MYTEKGGWGLRAGLTLSQKGCLYIRTSKLIFDCTVKMRFDVAIQPHDGIMKVLAVQGKGRGAGEGKAS